MNDLPLVHSGFGGVVGEFLEPMLGTVLGNGGTLEVGEVLHAC